MRAWHTVRRPYQPLWEPLYHGNHITLSGFAYLAELRRGSERTWLFEHWFSASVAGSTILAAFAQWWIAFAK